MKISSTPLFMTNMGAMGRTIITKWSSHKSNHPWNGTGSRMMTLKQHPCGSRRSEHGDRIFGTASTDFDTDWFKFSVAEGESIQVPDLTAFAEGSPMTPSFTYTTTEYSQTPMLRIVLFATTAWRKHQLRSVSSGIPFQRLRLGCLCQKQWSWGIRLPLVCSRHSLGTKE